MIDVQDDKTSGSNKDEISKNYLKKSLTNREILSQAVLFLTAGYETSATTLGFICYNLAMHQDYQQKLIDEIDDTLQNSVSFVYSYIFR